MSQAPLADGRAALVRMVKRSATHVLGLCAAGVRDTLRARRGREPYTGKAVGRRGEHGAVPATAEAYEGMLRLPPSDVPNDNEVSVRVILSLPFFRAVVAAPGSPAPGLVPVETALV
ncbi:hypothetical protein [Streptomyces sp. NPDC005799]|uniref:hypothetical protein n=1 Tax=Streptomyces sp. NPDC005799 TaxID=3154678 RepID=UPI0033F20E4C